MELSSRINLRLGGEQFAELSAYAARHGLKPSSAARFLIGEGLRAMASRGHEPAALAALLAAEHAVLMVASVLPEGERRMRELGQRASVAAEERLALFTSEGER